MQLIQAAILGVLQGLTEFLPVSSSGHLILVREFLGWELLSQTHWNTIFDLSVHAGTFVGVLAYFWSDVLRLGSALLTSFRHGVAGVPERRLAWILAVATIPAALAGVVGEDTIEEHLREAPMMVAGLLIVFGLLLWLADWRSRRTRELEQTGWLDGFLVGVGQALALAPGVSRSGITMTVGLAFGMTREAAARYSFLLSLPIIGGAALYGFHSMLGELNHLPEGGLAVFAVGFLMAALSGYFCIRYFLAYLQRHALAPFVIYRVILGTFLLLWFALHS